MTSIPDNIRNGDEEALRLRGIEIDSRKQQDKVVVEALRKIGMRVESVYDLVNTRASYPQAIPVLVECLRIVREPVIKQGIVKALTCKEARGVSERVLLDEFRKLPASTPHGPEHTLKWTIGNAFSVIGSDAAVDDLISIATDKRHGTTRQMFVVALGKMRKQRDRVVRVLVGLLGDDDVAGHALVALGKLRAKEAEEAIRSMTTHPKEWVREEAEKVLIKIHIPRLGQK
jgi:hypothetical protein